MKAPVLLFILSLALAPLGAQTMMAAPPAQANPGAMMAAPPLSGAELRLAPSTGMKLQFTDLGSAQKLAAKGPVVLFFAADWCPTCQAALRDINANGSRLGGTAIVVVDYDKSSALKAKYGIVTQHSFVQIDAKGAKLRAWNGGGVDEILKNLAMAR